MNHRKHRLLPVLAALLLLLSALPVTALAASGSTDITATVKHERTMTILPHPHGELLYVAPLKLYAGDEVAFIPDPDEGYALKSIVWYTTDPANATDITAAKKLTMPDADVTVKVEFAEIVAATVGGKVTEGGDPVPDAAVKLYLGTVEIAATITDSSGNYSFYNVEKGTYNIVVTKGDKVKTVLVTVDSSGSFSVNVALPVSEINSKVEHKGSEVSGAKSDISQTVVGGLDTIAEAQTVDPGDKVTIKLTVEPKPDNNTAEQQAIKREAGNGKKVEFLDLSLWKQVNDAAAQPIGDTNTRLLTIVIPFDFTGVDVTSVMILRHHGSSEKLQRNPAPGQEGYVVNAQAGTITLYAMKFSDYALAYEEQSSGGGGGGSGGSGGKTPVSEDTMPFVDVAKNAYYYDAVKWAAKNGITSGTDATHFSPDIGTTRAQVVTFLWRTAGCPEPKGDASKFVDVPANEYYAKAVAWAIEQVITKGTSETTFSPDVVCTRAHIVTFLARFAGVADEATGYKHGFTDVKATDYFNNAVAWAKDNKVTEGTSATTFSPHVDCSRAQVVTFLYRWMVK